VTDATESRLGYCKLCELEDFRDPELRELMLEINGVGAERADYPRGEEHRKPWETAMTARALRDLGALHEGAEILGVGAGREATIFWLTRHVKRVFATDLYLTEDSWSASDSGAAMLYAPESQTTVEWNPRRLVVQHMDALDLRYEDEAFDGIFSSSSIEHFGDLSDMRRAAEEMCRVLRPGGVLALATEYRLEGTSGMPGTHLFDELELRRTLLDGLTWQLATRLDLSMSDDTLETEIDFAALSGAVRPTLGARLRDALGMKVEVAAAPPPVYPHIVLRMGDLLWTSLHVALIKPESRDEESPS
jgi:SAM-dependent methyltransferase